MSVATPTASSPGPSLGGPAPDAPRAWRPEQYGPLVRAARALVDGPDACLAALDDVPDLTPEALAGFVADQRLAPWMEPALDEPRLAARLPDAFVADQRERTRERHRRIDVQRADLAELHGAFAAADVPFMLVKGLVFGARFHGGVHRRFQHDIDVLVRARDAAAAQAVLEARGYEMRGREPGPGRIRRAARRGQSKLDLHWSLRRRARRRVDERRLWRDAAPFRLDGRDHLTLGDEHALTFALIALCGDLRRGACHARHFLDLYLMLRALEPADGPAPDWDAWLARRDAQVLLKPCVNVLALLLSVWHVADEFPALAAAVCRHAARIEIRDEAEATALLLRPRGDDVNETWYRRAYPYSRHAEFAWRWRREPARSLARLRADARFELPAR